MKTLFVLAMLAATTAPTPTLTKEEQLTLENIQLRSALVNEEIADLNKRTSDAKDSIEKAHPGYSLEKTQQGFQLVKTPEPSKEKPKDATPAVQPKK